MFYNKRKQESYFAQQRKNNPNFCNQLDDSQLRAQVKRIVKDIYNKNIEEQDLIYFKNDKVISACIHVAREKAAEYKAIAESCTFYVNHLDKTYGYVNIVNSPIRQYAAKAIVDYSTGATIWNDCDQIFTAIANGYDINVMLGGLLRYNPKDFQNL